MAIHEMPGPGLASLIDATRDAVAEDVASAEHTADFRAIARLSGHLAAMRRAVYPAARRLAAPGSWQAAARELDWALLLLQCRLSGDIFAMRLDPDGMYLRLQHCFVRNQHAETALVGWLCERLSPAEQEQLAARYRRAIAHAPTRPHPRDPRPRAAYRVAFTVHGIWDRLLDTTDSRPGPGWPATAG